MYILKPSFYDQFQCIAEKCKFNCCMGWDIHIEKELCNKYPEYQNILQDTETGDFVAEEESGGYEIPLLDNGICPFCNKEQLCDLVIKYGEKALSYTCRAFPRLFVLTADTKELFLSCGCIRVVELLSEIKGPLTFIMEEEEGDIVDKSRMSRREREEEEALQGRIRFDVELRDQMIDWIQNRDYPLWFRQWIFVYSMDKVKELHYKDERENTFAELEKILSPIYLQQMYLGLNKINSDKRKKFMRLQELFSIALSKNSIPNVRGDRDGIGEKKTDLRQINDSCTFEQYMEAAECWEAEYGAAFDIIGEHLTVYEWYGYALKAMEQYYFLDNCMGIMLELLFIKHGMILYYSKYKAVDHDARQYIITLLVRETEHCREWIKKTVSSDCGKNILSPENIFFLLT